MDTPDPSILSALDDEQKRLDEALANVIRRRNALAKASARAYAIIVPSKGEAQLTGVSADVAVAVAGLELRCDREMGSITVILAVGDKRASFQIPLTRTHGTQIYAEDADRRSIFSAWVYAFADHRAAMDALPRIKDTHTLKPRPDGPGA